MSEELFLSYRRYNYFFVYCVFLFYRPYYEMKAQFNQALEKQKARVGILEQSVGEAKMTYAEALRNLEKISDEIHRVGFI